MALCYNFSRVLSILGLDGFLAHLAKNCYILATFAFTLFVILADRVLANRVSAPGQPVAAPLRIAA